MLRMLGIAVLVTALVLSVQTIASAATVSKDVAYACTSDELLDKLLTSINDKVYEGVFYKAMAEGDCLALKAGTVVDITDASPKPGKMKIKQQGGVAEFWVTSDSIAK